MNKSLSFLCLAVGLVSLRAFAVCPTTISCTHGRVNISIHNGRMEVSTRAENSSCLTGIAGAPELTYSYTGPNNCTELNKRTMTCQYTYKNHSLKVIVPPEGAAQRLFFTGDTDPSKTWVACDSPREILVPHIEIPFLPPRIPDELYSEPLTADDLGVPTPVLRGITIKQMPSIELVPEDQLPKKRETTDTDLLIDPGLLNLNPFHRPKTAK